MADIVDHIVDRDIDISICTETWLKASDSVSIAAPSGQRNPMEVEMA